MISVKSSDPVDKSMAETRDDGELDEDDDNEVESLFSNDKNAKDDRKLEGHWRKFRRKRLVSTGGNRKRLAAVDDCNLYDFGCSGLRLTWNNKRDGKNNIQERIDRFLANSS
ncbi:hypothetical protein QYF36_013754 [Acer negundo]|nr:hypothetical protein QYF36_013754 [Acer negundo]